MAWRQTGNFDFESDTWFRGLTTMTPTQFAAAMPRRGDEVGSFRVAECEISERLDTFGKSRRELVSRMAPVAADELDPVFFAAGDMEQRIEIVPLNVEFRLEYEYEVNRSETCAFSIPLDIQPGAHSGEAEVEELTLRDVSEKPDADPWKPLTLYAAGDQIVSGNYEAREAHLSGEYRAVEFWILVGESSYISARRDSDFCGQARGQAVIEDCLERIRARARVAA